MTGNYDDLGELIETIREEGPEGDEQVDRFVDYVEQLRGAADESGRPTSEGLEGLGLMMQQMFKGHENPFSKYIQED